jgi:ADP-ribose pyrophosphatase YjhB (NUDIX family)
VKPYAGTACVLAINPSTQEVLAAARKYDHSLWSLPGGKLDPNESPKEAARRELFEETGLLVRSSALKAVFADINGYDNVICVTYLLEWDFNYAKQMKQIQNQPGEAPCGWQVTGVLAGEPFGVYNKNLFNELRIPIVYTPSTLRLGSPLAA